MICSIMMFIIRHVHVYSKTLLQLEREQLLITQKSDCWDEKVQHNVGT